MDTDFGSMGGGFLGGGGGGDKQFGRSEAHSTIDGEINFGGSPKQNMWTLIALASIGALALLMVVGLMSKR